jgi:ABC-type multidrug transport system fused ATPase/permease subunit
VLRYVAAGGAVRVTGIDERSGPRPAARLIAGSSFQLVRVVISALSVVLPAITGLAAIAVLFATQALLTAILIPIGIGYALLMGRIQRRTLRDVEHRIEANRNSRRDTVQMLHALERQRFPAGGEPRWLVDYPERSWLSISLDAYRSVIFAKRRVGYLGELFQGISLLLILLVFGSVIASRGASWTVLLTYAVALGYAVRSLSSASRFVTAANRALPKVRRYLAFLRSSPDLATAGRPRIEAFGADWPSLAVAEPALPGSRDRVALRPGGGDLLHPSRAARQRLARNVLSGAGERRPAPRPDLRERALHRAGARLDPRAPLRRIPAAGRRPRGAVARRPDAARGARRRSRGRSHGV